MTSTLVQCWFNVGSMLFQLCVRERPQFQLYAIAAFFCAYLQYQQEQRTAPDSVAARHSRRSNGREKDGVFTGFFEKHRFDGRADFGGD